MQSTKFEDTKERALPAHQVLGLEDSLVYLKHDALYDFAKSYCAGKVVMDLGCGEGYGSDILARGARFVVAADNLLGMLMQAREKYARENIAFVVCDAQRLPFRAASFDTVISVEVVEHIEDVRVCLEETKRASAPDGVFIISTPNRLLRLLPFQKPWNRFHRREYAPRGLARALGAVFPRIQMRGLTAKPAILEIEKQRVKQDPFTAYPKMLAQVLLPGVVYDWLRKVRASVRSEAVSHPADEKIGEVSAGDFFITETGLRECINLVGICEC